MWKKDSSGRETIMECHTCQGDIDLTQPCHWIDSAPDTDMSGPHVPLCIPCWHALQILEAKHTK